MTSKIKTIDITPTWETVLNILLHTGKINKDSHEILMPAMVAIDKSNQYDASQELHDILDMLVDFQVNADLVEFQQIFGFNMGIHFWDKFKGYNHQIIQLWGVMNKTYRRALTNYLTKRKDNN